jgi:hypothetical protein
MPAPKPKSKERRKVALPAELRDSMREVFALIQRAKHDSDFELDYDDAIQVDAICGGKIGTKLRPYVFTFSPTGDPDSGQWQLTLHKTEIEDIADGRMTEVTMSCCTDQGCRRKFREADEECSQCDERIDPLFGSFHFPEATEKLTAIGVHGLEECSTREEVITLLGTPDQSCGGEKSNTFGYIFPWIKYMRSDCQLRFEFDKQCKSVRLVSIIEANWVPGTE